MKENNSKKAADKELISKIYNGEKIISLTSGGGKTCQALVKQ